MRKIFLFFFASLSMQVYARDNDAFSKGDKLVPAGVGLNPGYDRGALFTASAKHGVSRDINAGITVGHLFAKYQTAFKFGVIYRGTGNYHINNLIKLYNGNADIYRARPLYTGYSIGGGREWGISFRKGLGWYLSGRISWRQVLLF